MTKCHQCNEFRKPWDRDDECLDGSKQACMKFSREDMWEHGIQNWGENNKCEWPRPKTSGSGDCSEKQFTSISEVTAGHLSIARRWNRSLLKDAARCPTMTFGPAPEKKKIKK